MNKSKIEYFKDVGGYLWSPVTGCRHNCGGSDGRGSYCWAEAMARRYGGEGAGVLHVLYGPAAIDGRANAYPYGFDPTFHQYRLGDPGRKTKAAVIGVCFTSDLFGAWVPAEWIRELLGAMAAAPRHTYVVLTKNPRRLAEFGSDGENLFNAIPNLWLGATVTNQAQADAAEVALCDAAPYKHDTARKWLSIEPIEGRIVFLTAAEFVAVGGYNKPEMHRYPAAGYIADAIADTIDDAEACGILVYAKNNVELYTARAFPREVPWGTL